MIARSVVMKREMGTSWSPFFWSAGSGCLDRRYTPRSLGHAVRLDALRAYANALHFAIHYRTDSLQIGIPAAISFIVRVAHVVTEFRSLATNVTHSGHDLSTTLKLRLLRRHKPSCDSALGQPRGLDAPVRITVDA